MDSLLEAIEAQRRPIDRRFRKKGNNQHPPWSHGDRDALAQAVEAYASATGLSVRAVFVRAGVPQIKGISSAKQCGAVRGKAILRYLARTWPAAEPIPPCLHRYFKRR